MHYYQFNIADYRKDTTHLSMLEHGAYRQLLDWHYLEQAPIPLETEVVFRRLSARTEEERLAIEIVLKELFTRTEEGYIQHRVMREIAQYEAKADRAREAGKLGGRPKKTEEVISRLSKETETKANSLTNKPINSLTNSSKGSRLPNDWIAPQVFIDFCNSERPELDANFVAEQFKDYWIAQAGSKGVKADWFATWRNWVRRQEAQKSKFKNKSDVVSDAQFQNWLNGEKKAIANG